MTEEKGRRFTRRRAPDRIFVGVTEENVIFSKRRSTWRNISAFYVAPGDGRAFVRCERGVDRVERHFFDMEVNAERRFLRFTRRRVPSGRSLVKMIGGRFCVRSFVLAVRSQSTFVCRHDRRSFVHGRRSCWAFVHGRRSFVRVGRSFTGNVRSFALLGLGLTEEFGFRKECLWPSRSRGAPGVFPGHCPRFQVDAPVTGPLLVFLGPFRESGGLSGLWVSTSGSPGNSSAL